MNKNFKIVFALFLIGLVISCKQSSRGEEAITDSKMSESTTDVVKTDSSLVTLKSKNNNRKFIRTADIKFKVKDVAKSTEAIEDVTAKFGGFVTSTNLQSNILEEKKTEISTDSTLIVRKYTVGNEITIRVPNTKLDTIIKLISKQIGFLDYRIIKADDVSLQMLSGEMAQKRNLSTESRMTKAIDAKGKKLDQVIDAEKTLADKQEAKDVEKLQNLALQDQVDFSTVKLQIYQNESIGQEIVANEKGIDDYRPHIGLQIWENLKSGWFILEHIISFIVLLWPFALIGILGYFGYNKFLKN